MACSVGLGEPSTIAPSNTARLAVSPSSALSGEGVSAQTPVAVNAAQTRPRHRSLESDLIGVPFFGLAQKFLHVGNLASISKHQGPDVPLGCGFLWPYLPILPSELLHPLGLGFGQPVSMVPQMSPPLLAF